MYSITQRTVTTVNNKCRASL